MADSDPKATVASCAGRHVVTVVFVSSGPLGYLPDSHPGFLKPLVFPVCCQDPRQAWGRYASCLSTKQDELWARLNEKRIREMEGKESGVLLVVEDDVAVRSLLCDEGRWPEQMRNPIDGSHTDSSGFRSKAILSSFLSPRSCFCCAVPGSGLSCLSWLARKWRL